MKFRNLMLNISLDFRNISGQISFRSHAKRNASVISRHCTNLLTHDSKTICRSVFWQYQLFNGTVRSAILPTGNARKFQWPIKHLFCSIAKETRSNKVHARGRNNTCSCRFTRRPFVRLSVLPCVRGRPVTTMLNGWTAVPSQGTQ